MGAQLCPRGVTTGDGDTTHPQLRVLPQAEGARCQRCQPAVTARTHAGAAICRHATPRAQRRAFPDTLQGGSAAGTPCQDGLGRFGKVWEAETCSHHQKMAFYLKKVHGTTGSWLRRRCQEGCTALVSPRAQSGQQHRAGTTAHCHILGFCVPPAGCHPSAATHQGPGGGLVPPRRDGG